MNGPFCAVWATMHFELLGVFENARRVNQHAGKVCVVGKSDSYLQAR